MANSELERMKRIGAKKVEIDPCDDGGTCSSCMSISGKKYPINKAPKLPNPNCTSPDGCRCVYFAIF